MKACPRRLIASTYLKASDSEYNARPFGNASMRHGTSKEVPSKETQTLGSRGSEAAASARRKEDAHPNCPCVEAHSSIDPSQGFRVAGLFKSAPRPLAVSGETQAGRVGHSTEDRCARDRASSGLSVSPRVGVQFWLRTGGLPLLAAVVRRRGCGAVSGSSGRELQTS